MTRYLLLCGFLLQLAASSLMAQQQIAQITNFSMGGTASSEFTTNNFKSIAVGKGNIIWAGTQYGGLYLYSDSQNLWRKSTELTNVSILDMKADPDSGIWVAQAGITSPATNSNIAGGVNYFPFLGDVGMNFYSVTGTTTGAALLSRNARSLYLDPAYKASLGRRPRPWVAMGTYITSNVTRRGGVNLGLQYEQPYFLTIRGGFASVFQTSATPICEAVGGNSNEVWVASRQNQGGSKLVRYSPAGDFIGYISEDSLPTMFTAGFAAQAIFFDRFGNRWVGLKQGGLRVMKNGRTWVKMDATSFFSTSTQVNFNAIIEDEYGTVYIGTSDGLLEYQSQDFYPAASPDYLPSYRRYTTADGLSSNNITGLAYDKKNGRLLITSSAGVTFLKVREPFIKGVAFDVYCNLGKTNDIPGLQRKSLTSGVKVTLLKNGVEEETTTPDAFGVFELKKANETDLYSVEVRYSDGSRPIVYKYDSIKNHTRLQPSLFPDSLLKELAAFQEKLMVREFPIKLAYSGIEIPSSLFKVDAFFTNNYNAPKDGFYPASGVVKDPMKRVNNLANYYASLGTVYGLGGDVVDLANDGVANLMDAIEAVWSVFEFHKGLKESPNPDQNAALNELYFKSATTSLNLLKSTVIWGLTKVLKAIPDKYKPVRDALETCLSVLEGAVDALLTAIDEQDSHKGVLKALADNGKKVTASVTAGFVYGQYYARDVHRNFVPGSATAAANLQSPYTYLEVSDNLLDTLSSSLTRQSRDTVKYYKGVMDDLNAKAKIADYASTAFDLGTYLALIPGGQAVAGVCKGLSYLSKGIKAAALGGAAVFGIKGATDVVDLSETIRPKAGLARLAPAAPQPYARLQGAGDSLIIRRNAYVQAINNLQALYLAPSSYSAATFSSKLLPFLAADSLYGAELDKTLNRLWSAKDSAAVRLPFFEPRLNKVVDTFITEQSAFRQAFFLQNIGYSYVSNKADFTQSLDSLCNELKLNTDSLVNSVVKLLDTISTRSVPSLANLVRDGYAIMHNRVPGTAGTLTYRFTNYGSVAQTNVRFKMSKPTGGYIITSADSINVGTVQPGQTVQLTYNFTAPMADSLGTYIIDVMADNGIYRDVSGTFYVVDPTKVYTVKDGDWHDPAIWSSEAVPNPANKVFIYHKVVVNADASCKQIELYPPGDVVVKPGKKVSLVL